MLFVVAHNGVLVDTGEEVLRDFAQIYRVGLQRLDETRRGLVVHGRRDV